MRSGLLDTRWPGRLEIIARIRLVVIDVGHTPDGIRQALRPEDNHGATDWILVVGVSRDKKAEEIIALLASAFDTIVCTSAHHKGADAEVIAAAGRKANPQRESRRCDDRGSGARSNTLAQILESKNLRRRRIISGDRIRYRSERRARAGFEVLLIVIPGRAIARAKEAQSSRSAKARTAACARSVARPE